MTEKIYEAFCITHNGYAVDRLLADAAMNAAFIQECRNRGLVDEPVQLNRNLINLRKKGRFGGLTTKITRFDDEEYRFAAEIAARHLERRDQVTVDDILVDANMIDEFTSICSDISPGFSSLRYLWSALGIRKRRNLTPEIVGHVVPSIEVLQFNVDALSLDQIAKSPGIYIFFSSEETLYIGEAKCLNTRLKKHLEHSDNKFLARWIWDHGTDSLKIELHTLPTETKVKVRRALETELIRSRKPTFNVLGKLA